jgi:outer membrane protein TolC
VAYRSTTHSQPFNASLSCQSNGPIVNSTSDPTPRRANDTLHLADYLAQVYLHHPIARQSDLLVRIGQARVLEAKGAFDPRINLKWAEKATPEKQSFDMADAGVSWTTPIGVQAYGGWERNTGPSVNPYDATAPDGQWMAGIRIPITREGWINRRRTDLQSARLFAESTLFEQQLMLNDLLYKAAKSFFEWETAHRQLRIYQEALEISDTILSNVRTAWRLGERAAIDTTEASMQRLTWLQKWQQTQTKLIEYRFEAAYYLWDSTHQLYLQSLPFVPFTDQFAAPPQLDSSLVGRWLQEHPQLARQDLGIDRQKLEERWLVSRLLPGVEWEMGRIQGIPPMDDPTPAAQSLSRLQVNLPLFLRTERGALKARRAQIEQAEWERLMTENAISLNLRSQWNQVGLLARQIRDQKSLVDQTRSMLEAEKNRFGLGESNVFLLNQREVALINAEIRETELLLELLKNTLNQFAMAGRMEEYARALR